MSWFPHFFSAVLTFVHLYLFVNLRRAFGGGWWQLPVLLALAASFAGILLWRRRWRGVLDPQWVELIYS